MKAMQTDGLDWGEGYRPRRTLAEIVAENVDQWLGNLDAAAACDRRNGARNLLSELGDIELKVPRTRRPVSVIRGYVRRAPEIDRAILAGFVLSTRKVGETLLCLLGRPVAPVSRVTLDAAVQARRPLTDGYKALMGVVLSRKAGASALKRPVPVVLGLRPDGKKEIVDYRLARAESAAERFLDDLYARGLTGEGLEMICVDGGQGLLAALPIAYHGILVQRCRAHKICPRQGSQGRSGSRQAGSPRCHECTQPQQGPERRQTQTLGRCKAVACLRNDLDDLLTCFHDPDQRRQVRTTNAIERRLREVRPHPMWGLPDLDGPHPDLHPREQTAGNQYPHNS